MTVPNQALHRMAAKRLPAGMAMQSRGRYR